MYWNDKLADTCMSAGIKKYMQLSNNFIVKKIDWLFPALNMCFPSLPAISSQLSSPPLRLPEQNPHTNIRYQNHRCLPVDINYALQSLNDMRRALQRCISMHPIPPFRKLDYIYNTDVWMTQSNIADTSDIWIFSTHSDLLKIMWSDQGHPYIQHICM